MTGTDTSKELQSLLKRLRGQHGAALDHAPCGQVLDRAEPLLGEFVRSFLVWESTCAKAALALKRVEQAVVDFNELRVCLPDELVRIMGERYPRVEERSMRLRAALNELYVREHSVTLEHLPQLGKRECREYLESLEGVPHYVAARVMLMALAGHCAPVDNRILRRLHEADVVEPGATPEAAAGSLEHRIRAGELTEAYLLLQAWADEAPLGEAEPAKPAGGPGRKPARSAPKSGKKRKAS